MLAARAIKRAAGDRNPLEIDKVFAGSIPENYDRYMVPLIFEPYRRGSCTTRRRPCRQAPFWKSPRAPGLSTSRLGAKTALGRKLYRHRPQPADARLRRIATTSPTRRIKWRQADALALPFENAVLRSRLLSVRLRCSFPTAHAAYREAKRVAEARRTFFVQRYGIASRKNEFADVCDECLSQGYFPNRSAAFYGTHAARLTTIRH